MWSDDLSDSATVLERLHWYAANYWVMVERSKRWSRVMERTNDQMNKLGERNEELIAENAALREEMARAWKAMRDAGVLHGDDGEG